MTLSCLDACDGKTGKGGDAVAGSGGSGGEGGASGSADAGASIGGTGAQDTNAPKPPAKTIEYDGLNGIARNPIISHIFTADPSAHVFEGRLYVYASHDRDDQKGYDMDDYHVFSSNDLVNWQDHGVALDMKDVGWASTLYAPDCAHSTATGKYYLYFPNGGSNIGVAISDHPGGPFVDALGGPLVHRGTPGVKEVDWIFDPMCFVDDDAQAYLYFGGGMPNTGDNARVIRLGADMISLADAAATTITAPDFFEASFMHKREGKYYFSYSTTTASHSATIDYMMSDSPITGFTYVGTALPNPLENFNLNNHHSFVEYEGKWYVIYHNRALARREGLTSEFQRSIAIDNVSFNPDGTMVAVGRTPGDVVQLRNLDAFTRLEAETMADQRGIEVDFADDGGQRVGVAVTEIHDEDWIGYSQVDFGGGASTFHARVASGATAGGTIHVYVDGSDVFSDLPGLHLGACTIAPTGGWQSWADVECALEHIEGIHDLYLRFAGTSSEPLLAIDHFRFE
jgi:arabinoxylan arabinofuranohydrolase